MKKTLSLLALSFAFLAPLVHADPVTSLEVIGAVESDSEVRTAVQNLESFIHGKWPSCHMVVEKQMEQHLFAATNVKRSDGTFITRRRVYLISRFVACSGQSGQNQVTGIRRSVTAKVVVDVRADLSEKPFNVILVNIQNDE